MEAIESLKQWASATMNNDHAKAQWVAAEEMAQDKARIAELEWQLSHASNNAKKYAQESIELEAQLNTVNNLVTHFNNTMHNTSRTMAAGKAAHTAMVHLIDYANNLTGEE